MLLLGGAGTVAYWTDAATVDGGQIEAGSLVLTAQACPAAWTHVEDGSAVTTIVPGDSIQKVCSATLDLEGDHIAATVELTDASVTAVQGALNTEITASATIPTGAVDSPGTHDVSVTITVDFPYAAATNDSQNGIAALDALELTAVQVHDPDPAPAP